ncbi:hypothetical protein [Acinetobacter sp. ANC 3882]|uniref:hypothetical protein n=1 Tax=Acinetobacter sp. ANC 3882 TaxID=2923423 RepID=UPI001F4B698D|nr:hypothetical protein [Acinetobacter sp. ANC 3882]MCH7313187.1 hypothetical protein [Acinetobacter sp. ANC 3882]
MSLAALFWAIAALIQCCMLSQFGQKQLQYQWLNASRKTAMSCVTVIFLGLSFVMNRLYEGTSVGPLTWLFIIIPTAFFIQVISFYLLKGALIFIWLGSIICALIFTIVEYIN